MTRRHFASFAVAAFAAPAQPSSVSGPVTLLAALKDVLELFGRQQPFSGVPREGSRGRDCACYREVQNWARKNQFHQFRGIAPASGVPGAEFLAGYGEASAGVWLWSPGKSARLEGRLLISLADCVRAVRPFAPKLSREEMGRLVFPTDVRAVPGNPTTYVIRGQPEHFIVCRTDAEPDGGSGRARVHWPSIGLDVNLRLKGRA